MNQLQTFTKKQYIIPKQANMTKLEKFNELKQSKNAFTRNIQNSVSLFQLNCNDSTTHTSVTVKSVLFQIEFLGVTEHQKISLLAQMLPLQLYTK